MFLPPGDRDVRKDNRKEAPLMSTLGPSVFTELTVAWGPGISGTQGGFSDPLPRFQMLVNLPALFLSALSSRPWALRLHLLLMSIRRGRGCLGRPAAPIRGLSTGDWACCPPLAPQALFSSTFLRLAPDDASLPASLHPSFPFLSALFLCPPWACGAPQGVRRSERPSVAWGLALVPRLYFEEKLTGAPFRRRPQYNCWKH